jgi:hypothetical protein
MNESFQTQEIFLDKTTDSTLTVNEIPEKLRQKIRGVKGGLISFKKK